MSTQIQITPKAGITVGSTAVTSGTNNRLFFQSGGVVSQSPRMTFDVATANMTIGQANDTSVNMTVFSRNANPFTIADDHTTFGTTNGGLRIVSGLNGPHNMFRIRTALASGFNQTDFITGGVGNGNVVESSFMNIIGYNIDRGGEIRLRRSTTVLAPSALSTDIAFRVRNSADTANLFEARGNTTWDFPTYLSGAQGGLGSEVRMGNAGTFYTQGNQLNITGSRIEVSASQAMLSTNSSQNISFASASGGATTQIMLNFFNGHMHLGGSIGNALTGTNVLGIANGTAPTASFADRYLQYSADRGGTAGKASAHFRCEDGTINVLGDLSGFGTATPQARLDVRAQGALSTDIAFRVRNSADTLNNFQVNGDNSIYMLGDGDLGSIRVTRQAGHSTLLQHRSSNTLPSVFTIASYSQGGAVGQIKLDALTGDGTTPAFTSSRLISGLSDLTGSTLYSGFGTNAATFVMKNALNYIGYGVIPTGTAADHFAMYSADIVAGNAAPHFRTENGSIIKLYKQDLPTNPTNAELATFLSNLGLANLI